MGGTYRVWTDIQVNDYPYADTTLTHPHWHKPERLKIEFCQNWAGDDWFIRLTFKEKDTGRVHAPDVTDGYYASFSYYDRILRRFVKEFVTGGKHKVGKPCTFKAINAITKELTGMTPEWFK